MVVQDQAKMGKGSQRERHSDTSVGSTENVADEAAYKELDDGLMRAVTTSSSLEADPNSGNIAKTQSKATPNESSSLVTTLGGGLRR
ncbi:hypothetical protein Tco_0632600 [Tanacetum coccineum]